MRQVHKHLLAARDYIIYNTWFLTLAPVAVWYSVRFASLRSSHIILTLTNLDREASISGQRV